MTSAATTLPASRSASNSGTTCWRFLRAELLRQLGLFREALQALERCPSNHQATKTIKALAEQQDTAVRRLGGDK